MGGNIPDLFPHTRAHIRVTNFAELNVVNSSLQMESSILTAGSSATVLFLPYSTFATRTSRPTTDTDTPSLLGPESAIFTASVPIGPFTPYCTIEIMHL